MTDWDAAQCLSRTDSLILLFALLVLNLGLKWKALQTPIDYDTANHLYFAFLRRRRISFFSSYGLGIKYLLPRIYSRFSSLLDGHPNRFRVLNVLSSSVLVGLWVITDPFHSKNEIPFLILGVLLINSLWVNYATSATEFHSVVLVILVIVLPNYLTPPVAWSLQVILLILIFAGFKFVNILYTAPTLLLHSHHILEQIWIYVIGILAITCIATHCVKRSLSSVKSYTKTRTWLGVKSKNFLSSNLFFCGLIGLLTLGNLSYTNLHWISLQVVVVVIFIVQRNYVSYFFYPAIALGLFIALQNHWLDNISLMFSVPLLIFVFLQHTLRNIVLKSAVEMDIRFRERIVKQASWRTYLENRARQISWLKQNTDKKCRVYLWGSNVALLLLSALNHISDTFYSHNHLVYWSAIKDKERYAIDTINEKKPKFIIESEIMNNIAFPLSKFSESYVSWYKSDGMTVYKRI